MANIRNRYLFVSDFLLLATAPFAGYAIEGRGHRVPRRARFGEMAMRYR
jgi:hypothetical protein